MRRHFPRIFDSIAAAGRQGGASLLLAAVAVLVPFLPPFVIAALQYDRDRILAGGEAWRLLTFHWTHWNLDHLLWDVATFAVLAFLCERRGRARFLATLLFAAVMVPAGLLLFQPALQLCRGLSALDSALFALLALDLLRAGARQRQWAWVTVIASLLVGFALKSGIEIRYGATVFVNSHAADFVPVPLAHLLGAAAGAAVHFVSAAVMRRARSPRRPLPPRAPHRVLARARRSSASFPPASRALPGPKSFPPAPLRGYARPQPAARLHGAAVGLMAKLSLL